MLYGDDPDAALPEQDDYERWELNQLANDAAREHSEEEYERDHDVVSAIALGLCAISTEHGHCRRCENHGEVEPAASDAGYCEACHQFLGELQDERRAEGV